MTTLQALIIAIVEGLTEFLPVSSTGHMMIAEGLLGVEMTDFVKAFTVIIQFGAILSVVVLYWRRFFNPPTDREGGSWWSRIWPFYLKLVVGVLPAVVVGVTLKKVIDQNLESVQMVAIMLVVGGVFMLFCDRLFRHTSEETPLTFRRAFVVGLYQCIAALLPGTSRSMATIVGGMQQRLSRKNAAEFSFFLAVPTMFGATLKEIYDLIKDGGADVLTSGNHLTVLILGNVVAFVVGLVSVKYFIHYITRYGFRAATPSPPRPKTPQRLEKTPLFLRKSSPLSLKSPHFPPHELPDRTNSRLRQTAWSHFLSISGQGALATDASHGRHQAQSRPRRDTRPTRQRGDDRLHRSGHEKDRFTASGREGIRRHPPAGCHDAEL